MLRFFIPHIALRDLPWLFGSLLAGAVLSGIHGALHDQVTYSISPEYYTRLKFFQFGYTESDLGPRWLAAMVGFRASCWVGAIGGWFLARRHIPMQPRRLALRQLLISYGTVCGCAISVAAAALGLGIVLGPDIAEGLWETRLSQLQVLDGWAFVRVAYIHNGSYLGAAMGLVAALLFVRPRREENSAPAFERRSDEKS